MRILVTGAFGFLGGRLAQSLEQQGHEILLGSRYNRQRPDFLTKGQTVAIDWDDAFCLKDLCDGVELVLHAAGMNAQHCAKDPVGALAFNGGATTRLAQAAASVGVRRFIYLSTAHVYAAPLVGLITEAHPSLNPHPYATSHLAGENGLQKVCEATSMEGMSLRLSNVFGAPSHPKADCWMLLVNDLCRQAVETGALRLNSPGLQQRDFLPIGGLCERLDQLLAYPNWQELGPNVNIGSGSSVSVLEMARRIQACAQHVLGHECPVYHPQAPADHVAETLTYTTSKLPKSAASDLEFYNAEIEGLLKFCLQHFKVS